MGAITWPMIMLKATSPPTVMSPSITARAPKKSTSAVVALLTYWIRFCPSAESFTAWNEVRT
jgi:hypothetical protein